MTTVGEVPIDHATARGLALAASKAHEWTKTRDRLIREAVAAGGSLRDVAYAVGLSHTAVAKIVKRESNA